MYGTFIDGVYYWIHVFFSVANHPSKVSGVVGCRRLVRFWIFMRLSSLNFVGNICMFVYGTWGREIFFWGGVCLLVLRWVCG